MTTNTKSAFVLLGTLLLGVVLGVLLQTAIHTQRSERTRSLRNRGALSDVIENVVEPKNEMQSDAIKAVVNRYESLLSEMLHDYGRMRSELFDAMHQTLKDSVLFEDQVEALDSWRERNRRSGRSSNSRASSEQRGDRNHDESN